MQKSPSKYTYLRRKKKLKPHQHRHFKEDGPSAEDREEEIKYAIGVIFNAGPQGIS